MQITLASEEYKDIHGLKPVSFGDPDPGTLPPPPPTDCGCYCACGVCQFLKTNAPPNYIAALVWHPTGGWGWEPWPT